MATRWQLHAYTPEEGTANDVRFLLPCNTPIQHYIRAYIFRRLSLNKHMRLNMQDFKKGRRGEVFSNIPYVHLLIVPKKLSHKKPHKRCYYYHLIPHTPPRSHTWLSHLFGAAGNPPLGGALTDGEPAGGAGRIGKDIMFWPLDVLEVRDG